MIKMIAAISKNNQIGLDNHMPWHIPMDLQYFKKVTLGHAVIMGRKTYESIGHLLPQRQNIILSRDSSFTVPGAQMARSIEEVLSLCNKNKDIFVIGGGEIYRLFLPYTEQLYLTLIDKVVAGDTAFPDDLSHFELTWKSPNHVNEGDNTLFRFTVWQRKDKPI